MSYRSPCCTIQDQFAGSTGTARTRGPFRRPRYPRYTKVARRALVVLLNHHQYSAYIGPIPGPDSAQASRSERLILPAKCGACVQHDKRAVNDRSLIDTGRGTIVNPPKDPARSQICIPHLVILYQSNHCLIKQVSTYISQVTGNHPTSTGLSKLSIDSAPIYIGQGR